MSFKEELEKEKEKEQEAKVEQPTEDTELIELNKQIEKDSLVADSIAAKARRMAAEAGYTSVKDLLAREAGIAEKEAFLAMGLKKVEVREAKAAEVISRLTEADRREKAVVTGEKAFEKATKFQKDWEGIYNRYARIEMRLYHIKHSLEQCSQNTHKTGIEALKELKELLLI